ncbi:MAG TPA: hypothetical protein VFP84_32055 [Kofleriaceae bacterium]|nr:hypothetical protein [Kofleriaceae bacterium]
MTGTTGTMTAAAHGQLAENPFFVLGLSVDASRIEVERESQKLLGMLELGFSAIRTYQTPLGPRERTPELVRAAVAALRDPYRRLVAELWARHAPVTNDAPVTSDAPAPVAHPGLRRRLGWGP